MAHKIRDDLPLSKRVLPTGLYARSLLIIALPIVVLQIITFVIFVDRHWSKIADRFASGLAGEVAYLADELEGDELTEAVLEDLQTDYAEHMKFLIGFTEGKTLAELPPKPKVRYHPFDVLTFQKLDEAFKRQVRRPYTLEIDWDRKVVLLAVELENGLLEVDFPTGRLFSSSTHIFILWVFASSLLLLLISIIFMRNQVRPIRKLAVAAERFGKGRDTPTFKPEGANEVRQAGQAFLNMRERIKRQMEQRTGMLAGISHDLRTPLTRMKLQLAMMPPEEEVEAMRRDVADMEKMVDGYLNFVRTEREEEFERLNLSDLLEDITAKAAQKHKSISITGAEEISVLVKPVAFERALTNIINNAVRYANTIEVSARTTRQSIVIDIEDDGPGIPTGQREDVLKPFHQIGGEAHSPGQNDGIGLGLPIAMDIIHSHGGQLALLDSKNGGLKVEIKLPL